MSTIEHSRYIEVDTLLNKLNAETDGFHGYSSAELINVVRKENPDLLPLLGGSAVFLSGESKQKKSPIEDK